MSNNLGGQVRRLIAREGRGGSRQVSPAGGQLQSGQCAGSWKIWEGLHAAKMNDVHVTWGKKTALSFSCFFLPVTGCAG